MIFPLEFNPCDPGAVPGSEKAARGAEAGSDVQNVLIGFEMDFGSAVLEGGVAVVVHAVEGGGVGVCPFGFGGEGGEVGMGSGEIVEGHTGDVGIGVVVYFGRCFIFGASGGHCRRWAVELVEKRLWRLLRLPRG